MQCGDSKDMATMLGHVNTVLDHMTNKKVQHLFLMKGSQRSVTSQGFHPHYHMTAMPCGFAQVPAETIGETAAEPASVQAGSEPVCSLRGEGGEGRQQYHHPTASVCAPRQQDQETAGTGAAFPLLFTSLAQCLPHPSNQDTA